MGKKIVVEADNVAERLSLALEKSGWSINKLAKELGITRQAVSGWVNGKAKPGHTHLCLAAKAMGLTMAQFWTGGK